ncbi:MAG TPA: hypothetical protein VKA19_10505 [Alphaproteobacteria bacterium]|nr:hypothetical protein [Alphaproteobacteria bacterium]
MARATYVWTPDGVIEKGEAARRGLLAEQRARGHQIMPDIEPFVSPIDGNVVGGRAQKREHMRVHDVIEVGNEKLSTRKMPDPKNIASDIVRSYDQLERG